MQITNGWLDVALDGHYGMKANSRGGHNPKYLVMHGTAGGSSAQGIDDFFTNGKDAGGQPVQASAHFIVGQDGTIVQGISCDMAAWANCCLSGNYASYLDTSINQNLYTISIEHCKPSTDNSDTLTDAQAQASFELTRCICEAYSIPMRAGDASGGIIDHADIDPVNRARCPGPYPKDELWAYLQQPNQGGIITDMMRITDPFASQYFTEVAPNRWHCSNGNDIAYAILDFYKSINGCVRLPTSGEIPVPDSTNGAIKQEFEAGVITYNTENIASPASQFGCALQFRETQTVTALPDAIIADLKQLAKDAGL